jgi:DNA-binding CsgD family transcriptional regulator/PAS domain-containing protein
MEHALGGSDLARYAGAVHALASPLAHADAGAWQAEVSRRMMELFRADHAMFALPGAALHAAEVPDATRRAMGEMLRFESGRMRYADTQVEALEERRRTRGLEAWTMGSLHVLCGGPAPLRRSAYAGEVFEPGRIRDSRNLHVDLPEGPVALCVSSERELGGDERDLALLRTLAPVLRAGAGALLRWRAQRAVLPAVLDALPDPLLVMGADGRELHRNAALVRTLAGEPDACGVVAWMRSGGVRELCVAGARYRVERTQAPPEAFGDGAVLVALRRDAGPSAGPAALAARFGLTPREAEVALLLAARASNREIAARLFLSVHTVRHHAEHVFAKLGVHSRREIASRIDDPTGASLA